MPDHDNGIELGDKVIVVSPLVPSTYETGVVVEVASPLRFRHNIEVRFLKIGGSAWFSEMELMHEDEYLERQAKL